MECGEIHLKARLALISFRGALPPVDLPIIRGQLSAIVFVWWSYEPFV